jgi:hypothetical protein
MQIIEILIALTIPGFVLGYTAAAISRHHRAKMFHQ